MILIKLHPGLFEANGQFKKGTPFTGIDPAKAVMHISTGKPESFINVVSTGVSKGENSSDSYLRDNKGSLSVGRSGVSITDVTLEEVMNHKDMFHSFGIQILELAAQEIIEVSQDGVVLTVANMRAFTA